MSELHVFSNQEFGKVRSLMIGDEPWFVGRDAAKALAYSVPKDAIRVHVDDEDKCLVKHDLTAFRGGETPPLKQKCSDLGIDLASTLKVNNYGMYIINESGLYSLIFSSKLPAAKRFKRWVTSEVLPALRRTGQYTVPTAEAEEDEEESEEEATQASMLPERVRTRDDYIRAASIIATCRNERLPYVLAYLKQGGIEAEVPLPLPEEKPKTLPAPAKPMHRSYATPEEQVEIMDLLNAAHDLDYTDLHLSKMLGCAKNDVRRWRVGMYAPRAERIPYIKAKLEALVHKAE